MIGRLPHPARRAVPDSAHRRGTPRIGGMADSEWRSSDRVDVPVKAARSMHVIHVHGRPCPSGLTAVAAAVRAMNSVDRDLGRKTASGCPRSRPTEAKPCENTPAARVVPPVLEENFGAVFCLDRRPWQESSPRVAIFPGHRPSPMCNYSRLQLHIGGRAATNSGLPSSG